MSNTLLDTLFTAARQRVMAQLLLNPGESFHLRELARLTGAHAGTLLRELEKLTEGGLLIRSQQGNQVRYQADRGSMYFEDLAAMFRKGHGLVPALREALEPLSRRIRVALVFGSVARGAETRGSDVDVLVLGNVAFPKLVNAVYPLQEAFRREVNPVLYSPEEFAARAKQGDAFASSILSHAKLFVIGTEDDLAKLAGDTAPAATRR
ncbi:nucleotidyltransferase domain-containing protein [Ramlibacter sp.]|uniref:nucleotidyltransferase domain-containing protein n=1 Tax=Ramlibacter sp. TaxID=1917967 RepID=UPI003D100BEB